jgi:hypothetical protein
VGAASCCCLTRPRSPHRALTHGVAGIAARRCSQ